MNLSIYAIKVGTATLAQLDVTQESDIDFYSKPNDSPDYVSSEIENTEESTDKNRKDNTIQHQRYPLYNNFPIKGGNRKGHKTRF